MSLEFFRWEPFYTPDVEEAHAVVSTEFESGKQQQRWKGRLPKKWTLTFKTTYAEMKEIKDFWNAHRGSAIPFMFSDPYTKSGPDDPGDGTWVKAHFKDPNLRIQSEWLMNGMFSLVIEEVFD